MDTQKEDAWILLWNTPQPILSSPYRRPGHGMNMNIHLSKFITLGSFYGFNLFFEKKWCTEFFYKKVLITFSQSKKTFVNFLAPVFKMKMWWYFFLFIFFLDIPSILILFFSFIWGWICFVCMYFYQGCDRLNLIEQQLNKENYPQFLF